ncbi:hypothetical protein QAD02_005815 [Eretmocerus hayati]|uniref:Uncharacterized protein n=1 Tax=Eretmocerus hayati TaxID=131215 RepID=A0ACC2NUL9_9HYME|nr:hypothetical protein QAD02_005815 [Eretmocerus hayati]
MTTVLCEEYFLLRPHLSIQLAEMVKNLFGCHECVPPFEVWTNLQKQSLGICFLELDFPGPSAKSRVGDSAINEIRVIARAIEGYRLRFIGAATFCPVFPFIYQALDDDAPQSLSFLRCLNELRTPNDKILKEFLERIEYLDDGVGVGTVTPEMLAYLKDIFEDPIFKNEAWLLMRKKHRVCMSNTVEVAWSSRALIHRFWTPSKAKPLTLPEKLFPWLNSYKMDWRGPLWISEKFIGEPVRYGMLFNVMKETHVADVRDDLGVEIWGHNDKGKDVIMKRMCRRRKSYTPEMFARSLSPQWPEGRDQDIEIYEGYTDFSLQYTKEWKPVVGQAALVKLPNRPVWPCLITKVADRGDIFVELLPRMKPPSVLEVSSKQVTKYLSDVPRSILPTLGRIDLVMRYAISIIEAEGAGTTLDTYEESKFFYNNHVVKSIEASIHELAL